MTIQEAIEDLEFRKELLLRTCPFKWSPAEEFALQFLKEHADDVECHDCIYECDGVCVKDNYGAYCADGSCSWGIRKAPGYSYVDE